jgi:predicted transcriptional regulator
MAYNQLAMALKGAGFKPRIYQNLVKWYSRPGAVRIDMKVGKVIDILTRKEVTNINRGLQKPGNVDSMEGVN